LLLLAGSTGLHADKQSDPTTGVGHTMTIRRWATTHGEPRAGTAASTTNQPSGPVAGAVPIVPTRLAAPGFGGALVTKGQVLDGPTYTPVGKIPSKIEGGYKKFPFSFAAKFADKPAEGVLASDCSVRQYIKWDQKFADSIGGPIHAGFTAGMAVDTWHEDRDANDFRYGHRSGVHSDPSPNGDEYYKSGGQQDMANGQFYRGRDTPSIPVSAGLSGKWQFKLKVIDTSAADATLSESSVISLFI
jgi:hypothetical protein